MRTPIPIVAEVPRDDPGLGFPEYAEAIAMLYEEAFLRSLQSVSMALGEAASPLFSTAIADRLSENAK